MAFILVHFAIDFMDSLVLTTNMLSQKWLIDYLNIFKLPIPFVLLFHFTNSTKVLSISIIIFCSNTSCIGKVGSIMLDKSQGLKGNNREVFVTCVWTNDILFSWIFLLKNKFEHQIGWLLQWQHVEKKYISPTPDSK
jgi:hypothetical protein